MTLTSKQRAALGMRVMSGPQEKTHCLADVDNFLAACGAQLDPPEGRAPLFAEGASVTCQECISAMQQEGLVTQRGSDG